MCGFSLFTIMELMEQTCPHFRRCGSCTYKRSYACPVSPFSGYACAVHECCWALFIRCSESWHHPDLLPWPILFHGWREWIINLSIPPSWASICRNRWRMQAAWLCHPICYCLCQWRDEILSTLCVILYVPRSRRLFPRVHLQNVFGTVIFCMHWWLPHALFFCPIHPMSELFHELWLSLPGKTNKAKQFLPQPCM
jgi:hypothetical protein